MVQVGWERGGRDKSGPYTRAMNCEADAINRVPTGIYGPLKRAEDASAVLLAKSGLLQLVHILQIRRRRFLSPPYIFIYPKFHDAICS